MTSDVTQADKDLLNNICGDSYMRNTDLSYIAAHRIAHESPLLARIAELENCIRKADKLCDATVRLVDKLELRAALKQEPGT